MQPTASTLKDKLLARFADAQNGLGEIFARVFRAEDALCINETCVNEFS
jgi:hypothetical protein